MHACIGKWAHRWMSAYVYGARVRIPFRLFFPLNLLYLLRPPTVRRLRHFRRYILTSLLLLLNKYLYINTLTWWLHFAHLSSWWTVLCVWLGLTAWPLDLAAEVAPLGLSGGHHKFRLKFRSCNYGVFIASSAHVLATLQLIYSSLTTTRDHASHVSPFPLAWWSHLMNCVTCTVIADLVVTDTVGADTVVVDNWSYYWLMRTAAHWTIIALYAMLNYMNIVMWAVSTLGGGSGSTFP